MAHVKRFAESLGPGGCLTRSVAMRLSYAQACIRPIIDAMVKSGELPPAEEVAAAHETNPALGGRAIAIWLEHLPRKDQS